MSADLKANQQEFDAAIKYWNEIEMIVGYIAWTVVSTAFISVFLFMELSKYKRNLLWTITLMLMISALCLLATAAIEQ